MIHTPDAIVCAFADAAAVTVMNKGFFKYRIDIIVNKMVYDPVAKMRGKDFTLNRIVGNKTDTGFGCIGSVDHFPEQCKQIALKLLFKRERIDGAAFMGARVKIGLKQVGEDLIMINVIE